MKLKTIALALAVAASGITAGQAFAQDRDVTITRNTPDGVVTRHIRADERPDGRVVHRTTRVVRPDGSTVVRRTTRVTRRVDQDAYMRPHRVVIVHHGYRPDHHVVVNRYEGRPDYRVNRRVTVIRDAG